MRTALIATLILVGGIAQYMLMIQAVRDLLRRPRVRGDNKVLWGLIILCLPFAGAFVYGWMGPTSFRQRPNQPARHIASLDEHRQVEPRAIPGIHELYSATTPSANVTPIRAARSMRAPQTEASRTTTPHTQAQGSISASRNHRSTGS